MYATLTRPHNYVGRNKGETEFLSLSVEEQKSYISNVLAETTHKKDLLDYTNPSKKLKTAMDLVARGPKEKVIRELLRMHKFDFVVRTRLPPKHNSVSRARDENIIRDARRTLNWLYEVADEEGINVSDINKPCSHFDHCIALFLSGQCVFDLRNSMLVKVAYEDCFNNCTYAIKEKREKDRIELERAILENEDEELGSLITPPPVPKKRTTKYPLPDFQLSPLDALDEAMMVDQDRHHYDPRFMKNAPTKPKKLFQTNDKKVSPPQPPPSPSKWVLPPPNDKKDGLSVLAAAADSITSTPRKRAADAGDIKIGETTVLKRDSLLTLGGKMYKVTFEAKFEEIEENILDV